MTTSSTFYEDRASGLDDEASSSLCQMNYVLSLNIQSVDYFLRFL